MTINYCFTVEPGQERLSFILIPDSASEAVLKRRGADIKDVDFGEPGVDAGHLFSNRTAKVKEKHLHRL